MTELPSLWPLLLRQIRYQVKLLVRSPRAMVTGMVLPALLLFMRTKQSTPDEVADDIAGLTAFGIGMLAFASFATSLVTARESGVLRRWRASPLPSWCYFVGRIAATVLLALAGAVVTMAVGVTELDAHVTGRIAVLLAVVVALSALAWAALGTALTRAISSADGAQPVLMVVYLPVLFLSGALGPISGLPSWVDTAARYLPPGAMVDGAAKVLRGQPIPVADLAVLAGWGIAGLLVACAVFRWDPVPPKVSSARSARVSA